MIKPFIVINRNNNRTRNFASTIGMYSFLRQNANWADISVGTPLYNNLMKREVEREHRAQYPGGCPNSCETCACKEGK